jgi:hypothetical protein
VIAENRIIAGRMRWMVRMMMGKEVMLRFNIWRGAVIESKRCAIILNRMRLRHALNILHM